MPEGTAKTSALRRRGRSRRAGPACAVHVGGAAERQRARDGRLRPRSGREHERVVLEPRPLVSSAACASASTEASSPGRKLAPAAAHEVVELPPVDAAGPEGLGHGQGPVEEVELGRDQLDVGSPGASWRSARAVSSAATPPPATRTESPPCVSAAVRVIPASVPPPRTGGIRVFRVEASAGNSRMRRLPRD